MSSKLNRILAVLLILSLGFGYVLTNHKSRLTELLVKYNFINVDQHFSYITPAFDQLVNEADIIFVGTVADISSSKWNQDSGEYWAVDSSSSEVAVLQYHTLTFDVSQLIVNKTENQDLKSIEITILGVSPLDENADYTLSNGDNIIVFARETELAWKEGEHRKSIMEIETEPGFSMFIQSDTPDGLYVGKIIHDLGKGEFKTEDISLSLEDLILLIKSNIRN